MKIVTVLVGAMLGVAFCLAIVKLNNVMTIGPHFPAYGGDADFSLRASWFVFFLLPGFLLLGAWVGLLLVRERKQGLYASLGGVVGTFVHLGLLVLLTNVIEKLPDQSSANAAVVIAFSVWMVLAALGIYVGSRFARST